MTNNNTGWWWGTRVESGGILQISGGNYYNDDRIYNYGTVNISGTGLFQTGYNGTTPYFYNYGSVNVSGGTLDCNYYFYNYDGSTLTQTGGTIDVDRDMYNYDGTGTLVNFAGGTATIGSNSGDYCLRVGYSGSGSGETRISGGTVNTDHMRVYSVGLFNMTGGTLNITDASNFDSGLGNGYGGMDVDGTANVSGGTVNIAADWEGWGGTSTFSGTADINITGHLFNRPSYNSTMNIQGSADVSCGSIPNYQGTINQSGGTIHDNGYYYEQRESYTGGYFYGSGGTIIFAGNSYIDIDHDETYFHNVTISGTYHLGDGSDSYAEELDVNGNFQIDGSFSSSGRNIEVAGNWTNNGSFTHGNNTVILDGTGSQSIGGTNTTTFYNLTITNTSGPGPVSLGHNITVANEMDVSTAGNIGIAPGSYEINFP
ncbi:hypothetical protein J7M00_08235 [bacterium]|nr:hypothetical protein [bacterium]